MSYTCKEDVRPQRGKQMELFKMIANQEADFYLIGGSRFGGKSEIISMVDLLFANDPKYRSIKFRRLFDEIMGANGLWEKAENQYVHFGAKPNKSDKSWTFPSGAKSLYRHMFLEGDEESHRGKGYSAVFFDEINQFTWDQIKMLQTCLRSEANMNSFMVGTLNPSGPDSWCMKFVSWYLDMETGFPDENKCGKIRHYLIVDGEPVFADSEEYFKEHHYDLVYPIINYETMERTYVRPKRFSFFFFNIFSNEIGMKMNPQYLSELNSLPEHERQSQLFGNWLSQPKGVSMFRKEFLKGLDPNFPSKIPDGAVCVRSWDKAYKEPSEVYKYPDYTASIKMYKGNGQYFIVGDFDTGLHDDFNKGQDIIYGRFRKNVGIRNEWMLRQAHYDGTECTVVIPEEGGAGAGEWEQMRTMFMDEGFKVVGAKVGNKKGGKGLRFSSFCVAAEQGCVHILPDTFPNRATLNAFLNELENFDPDKKSTATSKDDWVDCVSDCFLSLQKTKVIKPFKVPSIGSNTRLSDYKNTIR